MVVVQVIITTVPDAIRPVAGLGSSQAREDRRSAHTGDRLSSCGFKTGSRCTWGYIEEASIPTYFRAATVVALPYTNIDQSGAALTAMSLGTPLVASRIAGLEELITAAECGNLVPVGDPEALATGLETLLADPALRERMARNARYYAETALSWDRIAEATLTTYHAIQTTAEPE